MKNSFSLHKLLHSKVFSSIFFSVSPLFSRSNLNFWKGLMNYVGVSITWLTPPSIVFYIIAYSFQLCGLWRVFDALTLPGFIPNIHNQALALKINKTKNLPASFAPLARYPSAMNVMYNHTLLFSNLVLKCFIQSQMS